MSNAIGGQTSRRVVLRFTALERERLFGADDASRPPLTMLYAPAGYGKTVAAVHHADRLRGRGVEVHWFSCPAQLQDRPDEFWEAVARTVGAGRAAGHPALEQWARGLKRPTTLILDDYQWATGVDTDLALSRLLSLSDRLSLVVLSRQFAALDGPIVTSHLEVRCLTEAELRFTDAEVAELAAMRGVVRAELVSRLQERCDGWPLPAAGVLRELKPESSVEEMLDALARYAHQVYELLLPTARSRRALLAATGGDYATPRRIAKLAGLSEQDCQEELRRLESLGVVRRAWHADGYRILSHPGLREPLEELARSEFGARRLRKWRVRNAVAFSEIEPVLAFGTLLHCEAYAEAQVVLTRHFLQTMVGEQALLYQLRSVPDEHLVEWPTFIAARLLLEQMDPHSDPAVVKWLFAELKRRGVGGLSQGGAERNTEVGLVALTSLVVADRMLGGASCRRYALELQRRLEANRGGAFTPVARTFPFLHAVAGFSGFVSGDMELSDRGFRAGRQAAEELGDVNECLRAFYGLALTAAFSGRVLEAERLLEQGRRHREATGAAPPQLSWMNRELATILIALERLDLGTAEATLAGMRPLLYQAEAWPAFVVAEAELERLRGAGAAVPELVRRRREDANRLFAAMPFLRQMMAASTATAYATLGDYQAAERELEDLRSTHPHVAIARARLALLRGDAPKSAKIAVRTVDRVTDPALRAAALLVLAVAERRLGNRGEALAAAGRAAEEMRDNGLHSPIRALPYSDVSALAEELRADGRDELGEIVARLPEAMRFEPYDGLTNAEHRIVRALPEYETVGEIAEALFVSPNTVKSHLTSVYRKLRVTSRVEAIDRARQLRLL
jgi:LuxR family maltose regulon positive regulatory protein